MKTKIIPTVTLACGVLPVTLILADVMVMRYCQLDSLLVWAAFLGFVAVPSKWLTDPPRYLGGSASTAFRSTARATYRFCSSGIRLDSQRDNVLLFCRAIKSDDMDWIGEIEKCAGAASRPTIFKDAMTTLSFRLEESLKEDVNLLAAYLMRRLQAKSSAGAVARAFIASGLEQMRTQYPDLKKFLGQQRVQNNGGKDPAAKESVRAGRGRKRK